MSYGMSLVYNYLLEIRTRELRDAMFASILALIEIANKDR